MWAFGESQKSGSLEKVLKCSVALGAITAIVGGSAPAYAAGVTASVNGSKLTVTGDGNSNQVTILQYDDFNTLYVIDDQDAQNVIVTASNAIEKIEVNLGGDDDYLTYRPAHYDDFVYSKKVKVNLGAGDDSANFPFNNYDTHQIIVFGALDISVKAGSGDDYVNAMFGDKPGGKLAFKANLGEGNDDGFCDLWGDVSNAANVRFDLNGGKGDDQVQTFSTYVTGEGYDSADVAVGSTVTMRFKGGAGHDESYNSYGGDVDGRVALWVDLGTDQDVSDSSFTLKGTSLGFFNASVMGKAGDDSIAVDLPIVPFFGSTSVLIDGGSNSDTCDGSASVTEMNCEL